MIIDALGSLAGSALGVYSASRDFKRQSQFAAGQAENQMAFQERMSNTAYQRHTADLKQAGLNPILAYNSGASAPTGASAGAPGLDTAGAVSNAASSAMNALNRKLLNTQIAKTEAETSAIKQQTDIKGVLKVMSRSVVPLADRFVNSAKKVFTRSKKDD